MFLCCTLGEIEYSFWKMSTKLFWGNRVSIIPSRSTYKSLLLSTGRWNSSNTLRRPLLVVSLPMICFSSSEKQDKRATLAATLVLFFISASLSGFFSALTPFGHKLFLQSHIITQTMLIIQFIMRKWNLLTWIISNSQLL